MREGAQADRTALIAQMAATLLATRPDASASGPSESRARVRHAAETAVELYGEVERRVGEDAAG